MEVYASAYLLKAVYVCLGRAAAAAAAVLVLWCWHKARGSQQLRVAAQKINKIGVSIEIMRLFSSGDKGQSV